MNLMSKILIVSMIASAFTGLAHAGGKGAIEGALEVPVEAGNAELKTRTTFDTGFMLTLKPTGAQTLRIKCHAALGADKIFVFFSGNQLTSQLQGKIDSMESCAQTLSEISHAIEAGASSVRVEVHNDNTLSFSTK
ncbi:hypothetical protein [Bdellovibrio sp. HCB274]|uniref:hypothetical protein n=1 Tax=Bdellovibrio sp. HCB274 TaxID=3394361 RepID=UPI0039B67CF8